MNEKKNDFAGFPTQWMVEIDRYVHRDWIDYLSLNC